MPKTVAEGCTVTPAQLEPCLENLKLFLEPYEECMKRREQKKLLSAYVRGRLGPLERRTAAPIASEHGIEERRVQRFLTGGAWSEHLLLGVLKSQVGAELAHPDAVLAIDPTTMPKKGEKSVGVARQYSGRLGKVENCQKAVFLSYQSPLGYALVDFELYLPQEWASDRARREAAHVPPDVAFKTALSLAEGLALRASMFPHSWLVADDEFGRASEFRAALRLHGERYLLDVPSVLLALPRTCRPTRGTRSTGPTKLKHLADAIPRGLWRLCHVRDGQKGGVRVRVARIPVWTKSPGTDDYDIEETLVVTETLGTKPERRYLLSNASPDVTHQELARVAGSRHLIEEAFQQAKGDVGLDEYEVQTWPAWYRHMTLSLIAHWFLRLERKRLGGKNTRHDRRADQARHHALAPETREVDPRNRGDDLRDPVEHGAIAHPALQGEGAPPAGSGQVEGAAA